MQVISKAALGVALSATIVTGVLAKPVTYQIDPDHTSVVASWNHFGFSNPTATFDDASGTITYDSSDVAASSINVTIPISTADTYVEKLTEEFMTKNYFNTDKFPDATFTSTKVIDKSDGKLEVHGDLTIKGTTKSIVFEAMLNKQGQHPMTKKPAIGFDATTTIMRSDFGVDQYVPNVSDEVTLRITTEAQASK